MVTKELISIIIPTFQEEKLLENMISRFDEKLKTEENIELIVSDGGSTDATINIARRYSDIVVEHKAMYRQNISIGRNAGARLAKGEIFIFINADTYISNLNLFFIKVRQVMSNPDVGGLTFPVYVYQHEEKFRDKFFHTILNCYFYFLNIFGIGMGRGECQVVKSEFFKKLGGYNETIVAGEDFDFFRRLKRFGKIRFLWDMKIYESPRRYRKVGYIKVITLWLLNAISVLIFKKSILKIWKSIR